MPRASSGWPQITPAGPRLGRPGVHLRARRKQNLLYQLGHIGEWAIPNYVTTTDTTQVGLARRILGLVEVYETQGLSNTSQSQEFLAPPKSGHQRFVSWRNWARGSRLRGRSTREVGCEVQKRNRVRRKCALQSVHRGRGHCSQPQSYHHSTPGRKKSIPGSDVWGSPVDDKIWSPPAHYIPKPHATSPFCILGVSYSLWTLHSFFK